MVSLRFDLSKKLDESGLDAAQLGWEQLNEQVESLYELIHEHGIAKLDGEFRNGKPHGLVTLFMIGGDVEFRCEEGGSFQSVDDFIYEWLRF